MSDGEVRSDERILGQFVAELEKRGTDVVEEYARKYPHLADEMRQMAAMADNLKPSREEPAPPMPERLGEFRIVREIARGGMGVIYEAVQERLGRRVALKTIREGRISQELRERFVREQEIRARLHQTHIVPIHTAGEEGGLHYFVMPYISGVSLHRIVRTLGRMTPADSGGRTPSLGELVERAASEDEVKRTPHYQPGGRATGEASPSLALPAGSTNDRATPSVSPTKLSRVYFRSVAAVMADVAEALQHSHEAGVLHRDLKPSDVMVDTQEQCWIIDFGLGGQVSVRARSVSEGSLAGASGPDAPATASGVMGTPQYMAPEQVSGKVDARSDVWGLGATLYELLALRRAVDGATREEVFEQVLTREPAPPRRWVRNVPEDLAAICRKAMRKEPGERYPTARAFAEDVRRWLRGEAVEARGRQPLRRAALWARRNKGWATALAAAAVLVVGAVTAAFEFQRQQVRNLEREARRHQLQQVLQDNRITGWREAAWELVKAEAALGTDDRLQALAVAGLTGLDAEIERKFQGIEASTVAFEPAGKRLLLGGHENMPAHLWDGTEAAPRPSKLVGAGPVAFTREGTPVQVVVDPKDRRRLIVWDVEGQRQLQGIVMPQGDEVPERRKQPPVVVMTTNARYLAAAGNKQVVVWETRTGTVVTRIARVAKALALAPDGSMLAIGQDDGRIRVYGLAGGNEVADMPGSGNEVTALTFYRDVRGTRSGKDARWGLVAGDSGSSIAVYDIASGQLKNHCQGTKHQIEALAVSPDNMTLASSGSGEFFLWDLATGQRLLQGGNPDLITGLAFSPTGDRLVCATRKIFTREIGNQQIWKLDQGRGVRILRGLATPTSTLTFSPDGRMLAVLEHAWRVGIWDLPTGKLRHVLQVPLGWYADNADIAFGPDGTLAFSSGWRR
jgi:serine/threonine protein kinase/WD40 repeat protein